MTTAKPTALKLLSGTDRKDRVSADEPKPDLGAKPPTWLPKTGVARSTWNKHVRVLTKTRVLTEADSDALAAGCLALSEALTPGDWHKTDAAWRRYWQCLIHFGLTPSSRTKIRTVGDGKVDPLAEWNANRSSAK